VNPAGFAKFSSGSYTFQLQYQYDPDTMFFINNSKGFSSGGLQSTVGFEQFSPDALNNLEAGIKTTLDFAGMKMRLNASYFYGWFSNVKVSVTTTATNPTTGVTNLVVVTQNAASAHVQGLDMDVTLLPTDYLEVGGFVAYTRDKYTNYPAQRQVSNNPVTFQAIDLSGTPFSFVPKVKYNLKGTYHFPVDTSWGDVSMTANFTHTGSMFNVAKPVGNPDPLNPDVSGIVCYHTRTAANGYGPLSADGKRTPVDCNPPYHNLDLSVDWRDVLGHDGLNVNFAVTNVTKNTQNDGGCYCNNALHLTSPAPQVPRMFVIKLQYSF